MTMQPKQVVVADDVLAKFTRMVSDLTRRFIEGSLDIGRCLHFLQLAKEGVRVEPWKTSPRGGAIYVLESRWAYDNAHNEYFTVTLESQDMEHGAFEPIVAIRLDLMSRDQRRTIECLRDKYREIVPQYGSVLMGRLYRVHHKSRFARTSNTNGVVTRSLDLTFTMVPICDFNDDGYPIPLTERFDHMLCN